MSTFTLVGPRVPLADVKARCLNSEDPLNAGVQLADPIFRREGDDKKTCFSAKSLAQHLNSVVRTEDDGTNILPPNETPADPREPLTDKDRDEIFELAGESDIEDDEDYRIDTKGRSLYTEGLRAVNQVILRLEAGDMDIDEAIAYLSPFGYPVYGDLVDRMIHYVNLEKQLFEILEKEKTGDLYVPRAVRERGGYEPLSVNAFEKSIKSGYQELALKLLERFRPKIKLDMLRDGNIGVVAFLLARGDENQVNNILEILDAVRDYSRTSKSPKLLCLLYGHTDILKILAPKGFSFADLQYPEQIVTGDRAVISALVGHDETIMDAVDALQDKRRPLSARIAYVSDRISKVSGPNAISLRKMIAQWHHVRRLQSGEKWNSVTGFDGNDSDSE